MTEETNNNPNLPFYADTLDNVPEQLHSFYRKEEAGGYTLGVEGVAPKRKVDEFRDNNRKLQTQIQELQEKYQFVDLEEYKSLKEKVAEKDTKGFVPQTDIEKEVEKRIRKMQKEYEENTGNLNKQISSQAEKLSQLLIDNEVATTAASANALDTAMEDILMRVRSKFSVKDGVAVAKDKTGETEYNAKGDPLTIAEYINTLKDNAPHLFKTSVGAGSTGSSNTNLRNVHVNQPKRSSLDKINAGLRNMR